MPTSIPEVLETIAKYLRENNITGSSPTTPSPALTPVTPPQPAVVPFVKPLETPVSTTTAVVPPPVLNEPPLPSDAVKLGELILRPRVVPTKNGQITVWEDQWGFMRPDPGITAQSPLGKVAGASSAEQYIFSKQKLDVAIPSHRPGSPPKVVAPFDPDYDTAVRLMYGTYDNLFQAVGLTKERAKDWYEAIFADGKMVSYPAWYATVFATFPA